MADPNIPEIGDDIAMAIGLLARHDLDAAVQYLHRIDAIGPILDPLAYRAATSAGRLQRNQRVFAAARDFLRVAADEGLLESPVIAAMREDQ